VNLHIDREIGVRRVQRTYMNVRRAVALPTPPPPPPLSPLSPPSLLFAGFENSRFDINARTSTSDKVVTDGDDDDTDDNDVAMVAPHPIA
jgi:hypothetical protein